MTNLELMQKKFVEYLQKITGTTTNNERNFFRLFRGNSTHLFIQKLILLSYENTTTLDWQGFSLDGMTNQTILGNKTIPMPAEGIHSIQVFGNDSIGGMYESDIRYFTVTTSAPGITINSPIDSEIFGSSAPTYDLSINDPHEAIWYTIDNGATNITASELTGTIDQTEWDKLTDGIVTITFYANNSGEFIGSAEVQVVKHVVRSPPPNITGYKIS